MKLVEGNSRTGAKEAAWFDLPLGLQHGITLG